MKKTVLAWVLSMATMASFAQSKIGYINSGELLQSVPEYKKADESLQAFAKQYQDQLVSMNGEFEKKLKEYQAGDKTMSDAVKEVKQKELQDLQNRIQTTNQSAEEKVQKKKEELMKPLLDKADAAIKAVAKEKGLDYVFDANAGGLLYANDSNNILAAVKIKLGIK